MTLRRVPGPANRLVAVLICDGVALFEFGIVAEVGLGALILIGWQTRWAALGMAIFTVVITFIFHNFWALPAEQVMAQQQAFFKNIAVVGGLLALVAWGAGGYSVDARRSV